jgi:hypothetical protein
MERGEPDRPERLDHDARRSERIAMACADVHRSEGVIENEDAYTGFGSLDQDLSKRVRHPTWRRSTAEA